MTNPTLETRDSAPQPLRQLDPSPAPSHERTDGTLLPQPALPTLPEGETDADPRRPGRLALLALAGGAALALGLLFAPAPSGNGDAPSALAVLTAQKVALESEDPALHERALDLGAAYLTSGPDGPYRDLIEQGQEAVRTQSEVSSR